MDFILLGEKSCNIYQEESDAQDVFNYFVIQSKDKELDFLMTLESEETYKSCILLDTQKGTLADDNLIWSRLVNQHTKNYEKWSELVSKTEDKNLKEICLLEESSIESVLIGDKYVFDLFLGETGVFMFFYDKTEPNKRLICDETLFYDDIFADILDISDEDETSIEEIEKKEIAFDWINGVTSLESEDVGNKETFERVITLLIEKYNEIFSK